MAKPGGRSEVKTGIKKGVPESQETLGVFRQRCSLGSSAVGMTANEVKNADDRLRRFLPLKREDLVPMPSSHVIRWAANPAQEGQT